LSLQPSVLKATVGIANVPGDLPGKEAWHAG
jgi:hypothetical protein